MHFLLKFLGGILAAILITLSARDLLNTAGYTVPTPLRSLFFDVFYAVNLRTSEPPVWQVVRDDPPLYDLLHQRLRLAWLSGGWDAASDAARTVMGQHVAVYANDEHLLALARAEIAAATQLAADDPERCKRYLFTSLNMADFEIEHDAVYTEARAFWDAVTDGDRRRREGAKWQAPSPEMAAILWEWSTQGPDPLSVEELNALRDPPRSPAVTLCRAELRRERNVLTRSRAGAAYLLRVEMSWFDGARRRGDLPPLPTTSPASQPKPATGLPKIERH